MQEEDGQEKPISFASRMLQPPETRYSAHEQELLAIIFAVKKFHTYLYSRHFTLFTDNIVVKYLLNKPDPTNRIAQWVMTLTEFQYTVHHLLGCKNGLADGLSRIPTQTVLDGALGPALINAVDIASEYENYYLDIIHYLKTDNSPPYLKGPEVAKFKWSCCHYFLYDEELILRKPTDLH